MAIEIEFREIRSASHGSRSSLGLAVCTATSCCIATARKPRHVPRKATTAGARVLSDAVLALGLDVLTNGRPAFLNFTRSLLLNGAATLLPPTSVVIELLESVEVDDQLIDTCRSLHARGFALALDDFVPGSPAEAIIPFASFVKVDVLAIPPIERRKLAQRLVPRGIRMIAEKVETAESRRGNADATATDCSRAITSAGRKHSRPRRCRAATSRI